MYFCVIYRAAVHFHEHNQRNFPLKDIVILKEESLLPVYVCYKVSRASSISYALHDSLKLHLGRANVKTFILNTQALSCGPFRHAEVIQASLQL